jgi:hypothetical protein
MTPRPHDALFRSAFEAPAHAAALLRSLMPIDVQNAIVWETVVGEPASYTDPQLGASHGDLLFSSQLRTPDPMRVLFMLEHQSTEDAAMPLRALAYQVQIWVRFRKEYVDERIPPIVTAVISHAPGGWAAPRSLEHMFEPSAIELPALMALLPRFTLLVYDLAHVSDNQLKALSLGAFQTLALWALRDARDPVRLLDSFERWTSTMLHLLRTRAGIDTFTILLRYLFQVVGPMYRANLHARISHMSPSAEHVAMSIADEIQEEGRVQGFEQGREEGRLATLRTQLLFKFKLRTLDVRTEARLCKATPRQIDRYLQRVLIADSLAAVFKR